MDLNYLISNLERNRFSLKTSFSLIFFVISLRIFMEILLLGAEKNSLAHLIHNYSYFFLTLFLGIFFLSVLTKERPRKILNITFFFYSLLLVPPLFDYFTAGGSIEPYSYLKGKEIFFNNFPTLFLPLKESLLGFIIEGLLMCTLAAIYVFSKTKSFFRAGIIFLVVYGIFSVTATPSLYIPLEFRMTHEGYSFIYLSLSTILFFLMFWQNNSEKFFALIKNFRIVRTSHFLLLVLVGSFLASDDPNIVALLSSILVVFFIRQFSIILNDLFDLEIDKISNQKRPLVRGIIKKKEFLDFGLLFLLLSLLYTILINNRLSFFLVILSTLFILIYSIPPLRLRKTIFSSLLIGAGSLLAFLFGYVSLGGSLDNSIIFFLAFLLFLAVSLGGVIKDRKDYDGDKKNNVKTIYTLFGLKEGKKISLALIALSFLLPLFLFQRGDDFLFFITAAIIATLDFRKNENHERVLFYAFLLFIYCFLRLKFGYLL